ncbi:MAG: transposase [Deltaproteobacteria bacterium]|nr:transposase [Deltaproteobacteria bacterium]
MDLVIFEQNKPLVLKALGNGEFDYVESASEVFETEFFRFIKARKILNKLAETYPTPRKKEEVPLWFYVAGNLSMRLHGVHSFNAFPLVVRSGGLLNVLGPKGAQKVIHPDTGDVTIACDGFNQKNHYDREAPCDQDFLRKLTRDTGADALMKWFSTDVAQTFKSQGAFDKEGIFIGDASYLFVPDNPNYEGSARLLFDESDHPVSKEAYKKMTDERKARCQWRRCYKMVSLLHTNRSMDFFFFVSLKILPGNAHESPVLYEQVRQFVETVGKGVMKRLILDRGFLDGRNISTCKKDYGIDVLIPVRRNMDIYEDAMALFKLPDVSWVCLQEPVVETQNLPRPRPDAIVTREKKRQKTIERIKQQEPSPPPEETIVKREAATIGDFRSWSSCTVPLSVVANRETYADGHQKTWLLIDTKEVVDPSETSKEYHLRITIEERHRQLKCFIDLTKFTSRALSMVVNQVVFIMLSYNLLQLYLLRRGRKELNNKTLPHIRQQLLPSDNHIIVYFENYYGLFAPLEYTHIIASLEDKPRKKIVDKCRRLRREMKDVMTNPRPPL